MQNTSFFTLFLLLLVTFSLSCCKEDPPTPEPPCMEDGLPCLTTEGKNMFACKVNGQPWIAETPYSLSGPVPIQCEYNEEEGWLTIQTNLKESNEGRYESIYVLGKKIFDIKEDSIRSSSPNPIGFINYRVSTCDEYRHDTTRKGTLSIEYLDTDLNIISGRFSMNLFNASCTDSIMYVTDGRFDLTY